jgi:hypothetical protein
LKMKEQEIELHKPFTEFLDSIVRDQSAAAGETFSSIEEIILRYKALKKTNKDLVNEKFEINQKREAHAVE